MVEADEEVEGNITKSLIIATAAQECIVCSIQLTTISILLGNECLIDLLGVW